MAAATQDIRWLYVDFNSYFASVEQQLNPRLRGRPVAVVPVETDATSVIAASYEAKRFGVRTGTNVGAARKLCPGLICVLGRHEHYVEFHNRIVAQINQHLPVTAVCSIDEMACRLMSNERTPERATELAVSIKHGIARHVGEFVRCSIGIAPNRYLAKVATDLQKPDGLTILTKEDLPGRLMALELKDFPGIGRNMEKKLKSAGIHDVPTLWSLSPKALRQTWGNVWGERMYYLLRGHDLPEEKTHRRTIGHSHVLAPELRDPAQAILVARRLTLKAASRMRRMGYVSAALTFSARLESHIRVEARRKCCSSQDSLTFVGLLNVAWAEALARHPGERLRKVAVTLDQLTPATAVQPALFDAPDHGRQKAERLSRALDEVNQRFGRDALVLGMMPTQGRSFSGTKVAFTRIPAMEEFAE